MKKLLLLLASATFAWPQLSPLAPTVKVGQAITLTAPTAITCGANGGGSFSGCGTTSVTFTAPASVVPNKMAQGCMVTPNDSVFNTRMDGLPIKTGSATMMLATQAFGAVNISVEYSWGIGLVTPAAPTFIPLDFNAGLTWPAAPDNQYSGFYSSTEGGNADGVSAYFAGGNNADHHTAMVDPTTCHTYEYYNHYLNGTLRTVNGGSGFTANVNGAQDYLSTSYAMTTGNIDAGGGLITPITYSGAEISSGSIKHQGRLTLCGGCFDYSSNIWPASAFNSAGSACTPTTCLQYGDVVKIKASALASMISTYCANDASLGRCTGLLTAMSQYGLLVMDIGSTGAIQVTPEASLDYLNVEALSEAGAVPFGTTNWEVADTSSLELSATSYATCPNGQTCLHGAQSYATNAAAAYVTVAGTIYPIAIQTVAIGLAHNMPSYMPMQVGAYTVPFAATVTGSANTAVTWTETSGLGSITTSGVYTPPTSVASTSLVVLKATAAADTNVSCTLTLILFPKASDGVARIDSLSNSNTSDGVNTWYADMGEEANYYGVTGTFSGTYAAQLATGMFFIGPTRVYAIVPPGNYDVNLYVGEGENTASAGSSWPGNSRNLFNLSPYNIETQGVVQAHFWDWGLPYHLYGVGSVITVPAVVSSSFPFIELGIYPVAPDITHGSFLCSGCVQTVYAPPSSNKYTALNAYSIAPDASAAHWVIDTWGQTSITSGQTLRAFTVTDWFTGVNNPTWSIVSGPSGASISAGGALTLASGTYDNSQFIVVKATNGTQSATYAMPISGGMTNLVLGR